MSLGMRCDCGNDLAVLYFVRVNCPKCGREYQIDGLGNGLLVKPPTPGLLESSQLQQSRKEFIPSESRTEVDPRLKYLVVYDNRMQGVAMFEDINEASQCVKDYVSAGHKEVVMYAKYSNAIWDELVDASIVMNKETINDPVNHPNHYTFGRFEVIDVLMDWFSDKPILWQVGKYIARAFHKGNTIEDLKKGRWYLDKQIQILEKEQEKLNG